MKKITILSIFILLFQISFGQQNKKDRIKALKTAYITEKLNLSANEAEKFWPIYNAYSNENRTLKRQLFGNKRKNDFQNLTEKQADEKLREIMKIENKLHQNKVNLISNLKKIISSKKILLLIRAEKSFNRKLLQQLKQKQ